MAAGGQALRPAAGASVTRNVGASTIASVWSAIVAVAFVPVYIRYLGVEAYGLIGVYYTLLAIISVADFGFTATVTRETARNAGDAASAGRLHDLIRSVEIVYWIIGICILLAVVMLAGQLSRGWLNPVGLTHQTVRQALLLIALALWSQWPTSIYAGALLGLQKHVRLAGLNVILMTLRAAGAVAVLTLISPTIQAFFAWQAVVSLAGTIATAMLLRRNLPSAPHPAAWRPALLRDVRGFATGVGAVGILGVLLMQVDKVLLSRVLTLEAFGYYMVASVVSAMLLRFAQPIYDGVFPRLAQLVKSGDRRELSEFYHRACQLLGVVILPPATLLVLFAADALFVWTGDAALVANAAGVLTLLAAGMAIHALLLTPWALQLAHGWTRLGLAQNTLAVLVLPVTVLWLARAYGPRGAAAAWLLLNAAYVLIGQTVLHTRILRGELARWYATGLVRPLAGTLAIALPARLLVPDDLSRSATLAFLAIVGVAALAGAVIASPYARARVAALLDAAHPLAVSALLPRPKV